MIYVGTCAWADHSDFYPTGLPARDRLAYYTRFFSMVEVDSSYYAIPRSEVVERWATQTPDDFIFHVKAYKGMTHHIRKANASPTSWYRPFKEAFQPLKDSGKWRVLLFQFPYWFPKTKGNLDYLKVIREEFTDYHVALEFRHRSWFLPEEQEDTLDLLKNEAFVHVICDEPQVGEGSIPLVLATSCKEFAYIRFHGRNEETWDQKGLTSSTDRFNYRYTEKELSEWKPKIEQLDTKVKEVHVLMNNNYANYAVENGQMLMKLLRIERKGDWYQQMELF